MPVKPKHCPKMYSPPAISLSDPVIEDEKRRKEDRVFEIQATWLTFQIQARSAEEARQRLVKFIDESNAKGTAINPYMVVGYVKHFGDHEEVNEGIC